MMEETANNNTKKEKNLDWKTRAGMERRLSGKDLTNSGPIADLFPECTVSFERALAQS